MDQPLVQLKNWIRYQPLFTFLYMAVSLTTFLAVFFKFAEASFFQMGQYQNFINTTPWKVFTSLAFPGEVSDMNLLKSKGEAIHFIVKFFVYTTIVYQYNVIKNVETQIFYDYYKGLNKAHFYWYLLIIMIFLLGLNFIGIYTFTAQSFVFLLLFSWSRESPNSQTDILFMFPVTRKQYMIIISILRFLILGQSQIGQYSLFRILLAGFVFNTYTLPILIVQAYRFIKYNIGNKIDFDLFKTPAILVNIFAERIHARQEVRRQD